MTQSALDLDSFQSLVGRKIETTDVVTASPLVRMLAWLDRDDPPPGNGDPIIPGAHLLYFLSTTRQSALGPEGGSGIRSTTIIRMTRCGDMPSCSPCGTIESAPGTAITGGVYNLSSPNTLTTPVTLANVRVGEPSAPRPSR